MNKEIEKLKMMRKRILITKHEASSLYKRFYEKSSELEEMQNKCNHNIGVVIQTEDEDFNFYCTAYCMNCFSLYNKTEGNFKNVIHLEELKDETLSDEDKINKAFKMYADIKNSDPNKSDKEVVEKINKKIKKEIRNYQKTKKK